MATTKPSILWLKPLFLSVLCLSAAAKDSVKIFSVTTSPTPLGSVTGAGKYTNGTTATLTFIPVGDCIQFADWIIGGKPVGEAPTLSFTVTSNVEIMANAFGAAYDIQTLSYPADAGATTGGRLYLQCVANATVTAKPKTGFKFVAWTRRSRPILAPHSDIASAPPPSPVNRRTPMATPASETTPTRLLDRTRPSLS